MPGDALRSLSCILNGKDSNPAGGSYGESMKKGEKGGLGGFISAVGT